MTTHHPDASRPSDETPDDEPTVVFDASGDDWTITQQQGPPKLAPGQSAVILDGTSGSPRISITGPDELTSDYYVNRPPGPQGAAFVRPALGRPADRTQAEVNARMLENARRERAALHRPMTDSRGSVEAAQKTAQEQPEPAAEPGQRPGSAFQRPDVQPGRFTGELPRRGRTRSFDDYVTGPRDGAVPTGRTEWVRDHQGKSAPGESFDTIANGLALHDDLVGDRSLSDRYDAMERLMTQPPWPGAPAFDPNPGPQPDGYRLAPVRAEHSAYLGMIAGAVQDPNTAARLLGMMAATASLDEEMAASTLADLERYVAEHEDAASDLIHALADAPLDEQGHAFAQRMMRALFGREMQRQEFALFDDASAQLLGNLAESVQDLHLSSLFWELHQAAATGDNERGGAGLRDLLHYTAQHPQSRTDIGHALLTADLDQAAGGFAQALLSVVNRHGSDEPVDRRVEVTLAELRKVRELLELIDDERMRALICTLTVARAVQDAKGVALALADLDAHLLSGNSDQVDALEFALSCMGRDAQREGGVRAALLGYLDDLFSHGDPSQRALEHVAGMIDEELEQRARQQRMPVTSVAHLTQVIERVHGPLVGLLSHMKIAAGLDDAQELTKALVALVEHVQAHPQAGAELCAALRAACTTSAYTHQSMALMATINTALHPNSLIDPLPQGLSEAESNRIGGHRLRCRMMLSRLRDPELRTLITLMTEAAERSDRLMTARVTGDLAALTAEDPQARQELVDALVYTGERLPGTSQWAQDMIAHLTGQDEDGPLSGETLALNDARLNAVTQFMSGTPAEEPGMLFAQAMPAVYERLVQDSGTREHLLSMGCAEINARDLQLTVRVPESLPQEARQYDASHIDILRTMLTLAVHDPAQRDIEYEEVVGRWKRNGYRPPAGMIPADAGAVRMGYAHTAEVHDAYPVTGQYAEQNARRLNDGLGATAVYLAVPHFLPSDYRPVLLGTAPPREVWPDLRLPARYVLVFHDPITVRELVADPEHGDLLEDHFGTGAFVIGGLLMADADGLLDTGWGWLLMGLTHPSDPRPRAEAVAVAFGDGQHPAARYLLNAADLLAHLEVQEPEPLPQPRGVPGSKRSVERVMKSPEALDGAFHGVHVIRYVPLPMRRKQRGDAVGQPRGPLNWGSWRRAHVKGTRVGIRDENDRLVGPVYGPDAVEGVTFYLRPDRRERVRVRPDLALKPEDTVYALPQQQRKRGRKRRGQRSGRDGQG